jgi:hypothetical protein
VLDALARIDCALHLGQQVVLQHAPGQHPCFAHRHLLVVVLQGQEGGDAIRRADDLERRRGGRRPFILSLAQLVRPQRGQSALVRVLERAGEHWGRRGSAGGGQQSVHERGAVVALGARVQDEVGPCGYLEGVAEGLEEGDCLVLAVLVVVVVVGRGLGGRGGGASCR